MNRLFDIATELGEIARQRFELKQKLVVVERNLISYERSLIPVGGWPGSNADQRKAAELAVKEADIPLRDLHDEKTLYEDQLASLEVDREVLTAERDAWQWTIRDRETMCDKENSFDTSVFDDMRIYQQEQSEEEEQSPLSELSPDELFTPDEVKQIEEDYDAFRREQEEDIERRNAEAKEQRSDGDELPF